MLTNKEKNKIEQEILKFKSPFDIKGGFEWNGELVHFNGSLYIDSNAELNAPQLQSVGGSLYIDSNVELPQLQSVGGYLSIYSKVELPQLQSVGGSLYIDSNVELPQLQSVGDSLYIDSNAELNAPQLQSVGGYLSIKSNAELKAPKLVNQDFAKDMINLEERHGFIKADGIVIQFISKHKRSGFTTYKTPFVGNMAYVVTDGKYSSHCAKIKQGILDIRFKKENRNMDDYKDLTLDSTLSYDDCVVMYRVITGACSGGTNRFLNTITKPKKEYTIAEMLELTKGQYGNEDLRRFINK